MVHTSGGGDVSACVKQVEPRILRSLVAWAPRMGQRLEQGLRRAGMETCFGNNNENENDKIRRDAGSPMEHEGDVGGTETEGC